MYSKFWIFILSFSLLGCSNSEKEIIQNSNSLTIIEESDLDEVNLISPPVQDSMVINFDSVAGELQRIFVLGPRYHLSDSLKLKQLICEFEEKYQLTEDVSISFFLEKKFGGYLDELMYCDTPIVTVDCVSYWKSTQYTGEFKFKDRIYIPYPGAENRKGMVSFHLAN